MGSFSEMFLKLELSKNLKILRHLELLPRPLGQDWSGIWLQQFSGTITIWPKSRLSDFYRILSDPGPERLARMIQVGQQSTFPKLLFVANRMKTERLIEAGLLLGGHGLPGADPSHDDGSLHLRGQAMRNDEDTSSADDERVGPPHVTPRAIPHVLEELKRSSDVFFSDDADDVEEEESDRSDDLSTVGGRMRSPDDGRG